MSRLRSLGCVVNGEWVGSPRRLAHAHVVSDKKKKKKKQIGEGESEGGSGTGGFVKQEDTGGGESDTGCGFDS